MDLGTGNGQTLLQLHLQGFRGRMVGVDYSTVSIQLAQELGKNQEGCENIKFEVMDIIRDQPHQQEGGPKDEFDLVLDKGTFDAVSLSGDVADASTSPLPKSAGNPERIHTLYPVRALRLVKPGGFLLVTSCNWTQQELIQWFTTGKAVSSHAVSVWKTIEYPKFKFGGHEGQGVCTVCFKKASKGEEERDE
jgi:EEF1A lysine methyltransferase 2